MIKKTIKDLPLFCLALALFTGVSPLKAMDGDEAEGTRLRKNQDASACQMAVEKYFNEEEVRIEANRSLKSAGDRLSPQTPFQDYFDRKTQGYAASYWNDIYRVLPGAELIRTSDIRG